MCNVCKCCCFFNHSLASSVTCTAWQRLARAKKEEKENAHRYAMFPAELPTHSKTTSDDFPVQCCHCSSEVQDSQYKPFGDRRECKQTVNFKCRKVLFLLIPSQNRFEYLGAGRLYPRSCSGRSVNIICINYKQSTEVL